jgi:PKD repeat protein
MGFGTGTTGLSSSYDRHVFMQDNGTLVFGTWTGVANTITSTDSYNDGLWHHVVAAQGVGGMRLYVDGELVGTNPQTGAEAYTGYWRIGGDNTWSSSSPYFNGRIDEFAVYPVVLSPETVAEHYELGAPPPPNQAPTADFTNTAVGKKVTFDSTPASDSDGTIDEYLWDFGDGATSTQPNPVHSYASSNTYTVTLTVTDDDDATGTVSKLIDVDATPIAPTAAFTVLVSGLHVSFNAEDSDDPDGTIESYDWTFDDAGTSTGESTSHEFTTGGPHSATLTVTDDDGVTGSVTVNFSTVAPNQDPVAAFTPTMTVKHLHVDADASDDLDGTITSYSWNWGDGTPNGSGETADHDYTAPGDYTVTLTVTDNVGADDTETATVTALNSAPVAVFEFGTPSGLSVSTDGSDSSDADGPLTYSWNWGDGTPNGTGITANHNYATAGLKTVTLTVTDNLGVTNSVAHDITLIAPPSGTILAQDAFTRTGTGGWGTATVGGAWTVSSAANSSVNGSAGQVVHTAGALRRAMLNSVSAADVDLTGIVSSDKTTTVGHIVAGLIARQVNATDYYQARARLLPGGSVALQLTRGSTAVLLGDLTIPGLSYAAGDQLNLRLQVSGTSPTTLRAKLWRVGTTEPAGWQLTVTDSTATLQNPGAVGFESYVSGSATNAPVTVRLDDFGATTVGAPPPPNTPPTAAFTITSVVGQTVTVDGSASSDPGGSIAAHSWNWGDGTPNGSGVTASHVYGTGGDHTITLIVTDNLGLTGSVAHVATTTAPPGPVIVAQDTFTRTATGGWTTGELGGAWTVSSAANSSVNGSTAALVHAAGALRRAMLNTVSIADVELTGQVASNKATTVGHIVAGLIARQVNATDYYQARARLLPGGTVALQITRGSTAVLLADSSIAGLSYVPGDVLNIRFRVTGTGTTTLQAKLWKDGTPEPAAWQLAVTDTTASLQNPGAIGFESYLSGSATNAPVTITLDNFLATVG